MQLLLTILKKLAYIRQVVNKDLIFIVVFTNERVLSRKSLVAWHTTISLCIHPSLQQKSRYHLMYFFL